LGIQQYKSKKPVSINTGEKPPREDELISVTKWNHRHGRNFILYGCMLFISLLIFGVLMNQVCSGVLQVVLFMLVIFAEVAWLEIEHIIMKKKMIKK
jgi:hypothetical protein